MENRCELCFRFTNRTTQHHLIPKQYGGTDGPVTQVCSACHRQIHALFTNQELAAFNHTLEKLRDHPSMKKYLKWVKKQDPEKKITTRRANRKK